MAKVTPEQQSARDRNPTYHAYWESRGYDERPADWKERAEEEE